MLDTRLRRHTDWPLIVLTYTLALLGEVIIFSATRGDPTSFHKKQIFNILLGTAALVGLSHVDYHHFARFARHIYLANLGFLLLVFLPGLNHSAKGAGRWIKIAGFPFQPSEFAKLFIIITLAVFLNARYDRIREPGTLLQSFLYIAFPALLIFKQPDLGTSLVILAIWFGMVFMAGAQLKHLALLFICGGVLFTGLWYSGRLKDYQKERIVTFLNPSADLKKSGYHVGQARIAIGSGGLWGKGLLHSTQVRGGYIPEKETDFIFTDIGEELGFVGTVVVTLLYAGMLGRGVGIIAASDEDRLGKFIGAGILTMIGFHVIVNIGMNIGIVPVAGVPLLLISYGGSSMLLTLSSIGVLQSISRFRHQLLF